MKDLAKVFIVSMIFLLMGVFLVAVFAIIIKNVFISFLLTTILMIAGGIFAFVVFDWYCNKIKKLSNIKFHKLKSKSDLTIFEKLYVNAYNDCAVDVLENVMDNNGVNVIKDIHSLDFDASWDKKYITFTFNHKRHKVCYHIYEDKVEYYIDSPEKYDHLKINKKYESVKKVKISIYDYEILASFFAQILPSIRENIKVIDEFEKSVILLDADEKTMDDINDFKSFYKILAIFLNILSLIMLIVMTFITFGAMTELIENDNLELSYKIFMGVIATVFDGFIFASYLYSISILFKCKRIEKDMALQMIEKIKGRPYKVKFVNASVGYKSSTKRFCSGVKLYFEAPKRIKLILAYYFDIPSKHKKYEIKQEILKKELELKYYKNSKMIVSGADKVRKIIKRSGR